MILIAWPRYWSFGWWLVQGSNFKQKYVCICWMPPNFTIKSLVIVRRSLNITIAKNVLKAMEKNNQTLKILEASWLEVMYNWNLIDPKIKVINLKYSKHWPYTVAHTINCVFSKMLNHGLNMSYFFHFSNLNPATYIELYTGCVLSFHTLWNVNLWLIGSCE